MHPFILPATVILLIGAVLAYLYIWCQWNHFTSLNNRKKAALFFAVMFGWWLAVPIIIIGAIWFWDILLYYPELPPAKDKLPLPIKPAPELPLSPSASDSPKKSS